MELENLVEKITREVMDSMSDRSRVPTLSAGVRPQTAPAMPSGGSVLLVAGSPVVDTGVVRSALSHLRSQNMQVTVAIAPEAGGSFDGAKTIRCRSLDDCAAALRNSEAVVLLMSDVGTVSRMANLLAAKFDISAALCAIESGKKVWALNAVCVTPTTLKNKVDSMIRDIESYGIKVTPLITSQPSSIPTVRASTVSPTPVVCTGITDGDCAGCGLCANLAPEAVQKMVNQGAERVSAAPGVTPMNKDLAAMIDHTLLKPDATREKVLKLCEEAKQYGFASCCVNPTWVPTVAECLKGSKVKTCVVIGFPLGANSSVVKAMETRDAIAAGADEVDMVVNVGALKAGDYELVRKDIEAVVNAAQGRIVKVILETALLNDEEKIKGCQLSKQAGADFVKTSTGFGPGGATVEDVALMRKTVGKYMGVKASGGIRDQEKAKAMIQAGATRIGASASIVIVKGDPAKAGKGY